MQGSLVDVRKVENDFTLGKVKLRRLDFPSGKSLKEPVQAYAAFGKLSEAKDNVILVCHALTGSHLVTGEKVEGLPEPWWKDMVGPGKALDTSRYCVICFNVLGSPYGSTSPISINPETQRPYAMEFPVLSVRDLVYAQRKALDQLGIKRLKAVVGGSLGGMQALEWAVSFPEMVERAVVIAAPAHLYPQAIALNEVQRQAIYSDPKWKGGNYTPDDPPRKGLSVARMLAMITYRSEQCFSKRWMRKIQDGNPMDWSGRFCVESYLHYHGEEIVRRFDANCYIYLTRTMDLHDVGAGRGGTQEALSRFSGKDLLAVGITSDMLFPNWQVEEISFLASKAGVRACYDEIESDDGHDAFLTDQNQLDDIIRSFWKKTNLN
jgi:homoserine O-acetyltransferase